MPQLILLIGAPGSGKSTVAELFRRHPNWLVINPDLERERYPDFPERQLLRDLRDIAARRVQSGQNVVFDSVHPTVGSRRATLMPHRENSSVRSVAVVLDTPLETCRQRILCRQSTLRSHQTMTDDVLTSFWETLAANPPTLEEGFSDIVWLNGNLPSDDWQMILAHHLVL